MFVLFIVLLIIDCFLLGTVVLLQAGKGGGLAALGGGSSTESFFGGRQAATILTKMSWWCGGIFLGLSMVLAGLSSGRGTPRSILQDDLGPPTPVAPAVPLPLDVQPQGDPGQPPPQQQDPGGQS